MRVIVSDKADEDLIRIHSYLTERSPRAADRVLQTINRRLTNLSDFPFIGRVRPEFGADVRSLVAGNWVIFYIVERAHIAVIRVIDGRRDVNAEFRR